MDKETELHIKRQLAGRKGGLIGGKARVPKGFAVTGLARSAGKKGGNAKRK